MSQAAASPDDPRAGLCPANNPLPLLLERRQQAVSEPVHVIQQHEPGKRPLVLLQEALDRIGVHLDVIGQSALEPLEVLRLEVFGAAMGSVAALDVDPPKVIVGQRQAREDGLDAVVDELQDAAFILRFDLSRAARGARPAAKGSHRGYEESHGRDQKRSCKWSS